jgi:hypothetical protein
MGDPVNPERYDVLPDIEVVTDAAGAELAECSHCRRRTVRVVVGESVINRACGVGGCDGTFILATRERGNLLDPPWRTS